MACDIHRTNGMYDAVVADSIADVAVAESYTSVAVATRLATHAVASENTAMAIALGEKTAAIALKKGAIALAGTASTAVAKGVLGSFLVLVDLCRDGDVKNVVAVQVDGEHIMPDVLYMLYKGCVMPAFVEDRSKYPIVEITTNLKELDKSAAEAKGLYIPHYE